MHNAAMQHTEHFEHELADQMQIVSTMYSPRYPQHAPPPQPPAPSSATHRVTDTSNLNVRPEKECNHGKKPEYSTSIRVTGNAFNPMTDSASGLFYVLSSLGKIVSCSATSLAITGYAPNELVGNCWIDFLHADDIDAFCDSLTRVFHMQTQMKSQFRFRKRRTGEYVLLETFGHPKHEYLFAVAHPYDALNFQRHTATIDARWELKLENEWLKHRVIELTAEYNDLVSPHSNPVSPFLSSTPWSVAASSTSFDKNTSLNEKPKWKRRVSLIFFWWVACKEKAVVSNRLCYCFGFQSIGNNELKGVCCRRLYMCRLWRHAIPRMAQRSTRTEDSL